MVLLVFFPTTLCLGGVLCTHISRVAHWPFEGRCTDRPSYSAAAKKKLFLPDGFLNDLKDHPNGSKDRSSEKRGSVFGIPSFHQLRRMSDTSMRQVKERLRRMSTTGRDLARNRFWNRFSFLALNLNLGYIRHMFDLVLLLGFQPLISLNSEKKILQLCAYSISAFNGYEKKTFCLLHFHHMLKKTNKVLILGFQR